MVWLMLKKVRIYWHGYNFAIAKNSTTGEYFVLNYYRDSGFFMLNAVTPQNFSTNYGTMKKMGYFGEPYLENEYRL